ncbi:MAG: hypothetical protein HY810_02585 [Candidatus Omnitrophica bacterium]|nr:hypothetical protein [Candidatus Omnitrophota bacterium]
MKNFFRICSNMAMLVLCVLLFSGGRLFAQTEYSVEDDIEVKTQEEEGVVSLDFKDADLRDVLKVFSQQSGLNFIAAKEIEEKKITLYMSDVKVEDALKTLLDANNLGVYQAAGSNILIVRQKPTAPLQTETRVYKLRYFFGNISPGAYLMGEKSSDARSKGVASGWDNIIKPLLSEFGSMVAYSNLVIITDVPERFKLIDQVISEVDKPVPEVMIEVELIETTTDFLKELGVKWNKEFISYASGPARITPFPFTPWEQYQSGEIGITPLSKDGAVFQYGLISSTALSWVLEMLQTNTDTKFLSKPRILCQDREWAEIKIVADQVVSLKTTRDKDGNIEMEAERMEVGTILRLVPLINDQEGYVSMVLEPSVSRPEDSNFKDSLGNIFIDPQQRSLRTVVMVKDSETIAIGGFITAEDRETKAKVPWIGDIPLFGSFFRHNKKERVDVELLIFITPKIVVPTEKIKMWIDDEESMPSKTGLQQNVEVSPTHPQATIKPELAPVETSQLSFREQEGIADMKLDLTLKSSSLGVVDLVK